MKLLKLMVICLLLCLSTLTASTQLNLKELLDNISTYFDLGNSYLQADLTIQAENAEPETISFEAFVRSDQQLRINVFAPPRVKDTVIIKNQNTVWIYLSRLQKLKTLTTGQSENFNLFGSEFDLQDIFGQFKGWEGNITRTKRLGSVWQYEVELNKIATANTNKLQFTVTEPNWYPESILYLEKTEKDKYLPIKKLTVERSLEKKGKNYPQLLRMQDMVKSEYAILNIKNLALGRTFEEGLFSKPKVPDQAISNQ